MVSFDRRRVAAWEAFDGDASDFDAPTTLGDDLACDEDKALVDAVFGDVATLSTGALEHAQKIVLETLRANSDHSRLLRAAIPEVQVQDMGSPLVDPRLRPKCDRVRATKR
jgi:hypothetical protein